MLISYTTYPSLYYNIYISFHVSNSLTKYFFNIYIFYHTEVPHKSVSLPEAIQ